MAFRTYQPSPCLDYYIKKTLQCRKHTGHVKYNIKRDRKRRFKLNPLNKPDKNQVAHGSGRKSLQAAASQKEPCAEE